jgi:hypothetical protein
MLNNLLILAVGILLALATLGSPVPKMHWGKWVRALALIALYLATALVTLWLFDAKSAFAILEFSLVLTGLSKLIAINFGIVQSARYPKHRRCY